MRPEEYYREDAVEGGGGCDGEYGDYFDRGDGAGFYDVRGEDSYDCDDGAEAEDLEDAGYEEGFCEGRGAVGRNGYVHIVRRSVGEVGGCLEMVLNLLSRKSSEWCVYQQRKEILKRESTKQ